MRILLILLAISCGPKLDYKNNRTATDKMKYKKVSSSTILINQEKNLGLNSTEIINYTSNITNTTTVDVSNINIVEGDDGYIIDIGSIGMKKIKVNNLKQCGLSGTEKCTSAIIRVYLNDLGGLDAGLSGFVNTDEHYSGGDIKITGTDGQSVLGLNVGNAITVASYTIPNNDRKLTKRDFTNNSQVVDYPIVINFEDAGHGKYTASIEIEVALGPVP